MGEVTLALDVCTEEGCGLKQIVDIGTTDCFVLLAEGLTQIAQYIDRVGIWDGFYIDLFIFS